MRTCDRTQDRLPVNGSPHRGWVLGGNKGALGALWGGLCSASTITPAISARCHQAASRTPAPGIGQQRAVCCTLARGAKKHPTAFLGALLGACCCLCLWLWAATSSMCSQTRAHAPTATACRQLGGDLLLSRLLDFKRRSVFAPCLALPST